MHERHSSRFIHLQMQEIPGDVNSVPPPGNPVKPRDHESGYISREIEGESDQKAENEVMPQNSVILAKPHGKQKAKE